MCVWGNLPRGNHFEGGSVCGVEKRYGEEAGRGGGEGGVKWGREAEVVGAEVGLGRLSPDVGQPYMFCHAIATPGGQAGRLGPPPGTG